MIGVDDYSRVKAINAAKLETTDDLGTLLQTASGLRRDQSASQKGFAEYN